MIRVLAKNVAGKAGETITIQGWLHKKRLLGGLNFITLRDRSGLVQNLVDSKEEIEKLRGLQIGTILAITGKVVADDRAPGGAELHDVTIEVQVPVTEEPPIEIDKPLDHKPENLDTLLNNRVVGLRNIRESDIFKVQATICSSLRDYFVENEFTEIHTPKLLAEPTEGGAEVFSLDYFGKTATLAQSPQFYKQMSVGAFERVFEIAPVFRAEPSATTRHMTEYTSIDGEMGFINLQDLQDSLSAIINKIIDDVWAKHEPQLKSWNATKPNLTAKLPSLSLEEIHELYSKSTGENSVGEKDLRPDEERWICDYSKKKLGSEAIFVTDWPASEMKFYHKANDAKPQYADRIDLLFRGVEIVTGSMREHHYDKVIQQLKDLASADPEDPGFQPLLSAMKHGMPPHGGFGMGLERVTQKIVGLGNVKEATLFPRDINRLNP